LALTRTLFHFSVLTLLVWGTGCTVFKDHTVQQTPDKLTGSDEIDSVTLTSGKVIQFGEDGGAVHAVSGFGYGPNSNVGGNIQGMTQDGQWVLLPLQDVVSLEVKKEGEGKHVLLAAAVLAATVVAVGAMIQQF